MTNKTEPCLQMHLSRLLSQKLNCPVLEVANKLSATTGVSPSNTATIMRAVDNVIGNNAVVFCEKIDHSNGVPPVFKMPNSNASFHVNTLVLMLNKYLDDGHDIYGSVAATASVDRDSTTRILNVLADWLHDHRITPKYMAQPAPVTEVQPTNARGEFAQPQIVTFNVHNNFELSFAKVLSVLMIDVAVKSQQPKSANLSLKIVNYDRDSLVKSAVAAMTTAYTSKDAAESARATRSLIGYLVMFLALSHDAHTNYGDGTAAHWSMSSLMMQLALEMVNPEYETIISTQQKENEGARSECEKLRNELHEANASNKKHYDANAKLREEIAYLRANVVDDSHIAEMERVRLEGDKLIAENNKLRDDAVRQSDAIRDMQAEIDRLHDIEAKYKELLATCNRNEVGSTIDNITATTATVGSQYSVKTDANGHASGIGMINQLPELKLPPQKTSHDVITSNKEVYAFYGNVTININEGK